MAKNVIYNYLDRCNFLVNSPHIDEEINLTDFIHLIFSRNTKNAYNEYLPFEDSGCDEYLYWLATNKTEGTNRIYNPLVMYSDKNKQNKTIYLTNVVTNDLTALYNAIKADFCIMSPITYAGKSRVYNNARYLYAIAFDLDNLNQNEMIDLFHQTKSFTPKFNIIVSSGHGVHLYFLLKKPVLMYRRNIKLLNKLKYGLTYLIWNSYTSPIPPQYQPISQGFRIPGSKTKQGDIIRAFKTNNKNLWDIEDLNNYITVTEHKLTDDEVAILKSSTYKSYGLTLKDAKEKYPEWYHNRIELGLKPNKWHVKRALYDWFKVQIYKHKPKQGHRYFSLMCLVALAYKCDIDYNELKTTLYNEFLPFLDENTETSDNHFTKDDIKAVLKTFNEESNNMTLDRINQLSDFNILRNKRNGRKQDLHLKGARALQQIYNPNWREGNGRPKGSFIEAKNSPQAKKIKEWRDSNPQGNKSQCSRDLRLSRPTVIKWWDELI